MIVITSSSYQDDAKVHVLKADYKARRLNVHAEAKVVGDFQFVYRHHEHRIDEIFPANDIGAIYYIFNIASDRLQHFFSYNSETNTCEMRGKVEINARIFATHWHEGVFSIVENYNEQHGIRVRRYNPANDETEIVSVENLDAKVNYKFIVII